MPSHRQAEEAGVEVGARGPGAVPLGERLRLFHPSLPNPLERWGRHRGLGPELPERPQGLGELARGDQIRIARLVELYRQLRGSGQALPPELRADHGRARSRSVLGATHGEHELERDQGDASAAQHRDLQPIVQPLVQERWQRRVRWHAGRWRADEAVRARLRRGRGRGPSASRGGKGGDTRPNASPDRERDRGQRPK